MAGLVGLVNIPKRAFFPGIGALHLKQHMESGSLTRSDKHHWCFLLVILPLYFFLFSSQVTFGPGAMTDCVSLENEIEDQVDEGKDLYTQFNLYKVVQLS